MAAYINLLPISTAKRSFNDISQDITEMNDLQLYRRYRFDKDTILWIAALLNDDLKPASQRNRSIDVVTQVLTALRFYACGSFQNVVGDTLGISQASVSRITLRVSDALCDRRSRFVKWPDNEELMFIKQKFFSMAGFPGVVGCIDGTHVRIQSPHNNPIDYLNRKRYPSINVMATCDSMGAFTCITAKWPGSAHDSWVLRQSR